jgi:predicted ATP-grasp superfamily ATP-dependent carboligase
MTDTNNINEGKKLIKKIEDFKNEIDELVQRISNLEMNRVRVRDANYLSQTPSPANQDLN